MYVTHHLLSQKLSFYTHVHLHAHRDLFLTLTPTLWWGILSPLCVSSGATVALLYFNTPIWKVLCISAQIRSFTNMFTQVTTIWAHIFAYNTYTSLAKCLVFMTHLRNVTMHFLSCLLYKMKKVKVGNKTNAYLLTRSTVKKDFFICWFLPFFYIFQVKLILILDKDKPNKCQTVLKC